ncbi:MULTISPECIES: replication-associated recombination protein A [unclassified Streptococcus]|uniref:replication-associated recombination protein A n=1 Tax=unclassified Streptococcus TaxID=2608887 RepID=UPI00107167A2|nr:MULTISPECIES: replication-associated recombination protein A [unclassified Streptococcus]MBF0806236.1 replication-associated recombination protein A [Streptococcus sp. 19428wA2_WM07]TFU28181.1 replication-associated recombination protein A [Streptococcus sp. WM07]
MHQNLALRMRPQNLEQIVGQAHLVGPGKVLRRMVDAGKLFSMILYGPPGIGKTSIASALAGSTGQVFRTFNATTDTKQRMKEIAEEARFSGSLVLLLDEIHRLNKDKQDFFLPLLESGQLTIIGATTENPYYSINPAIRSRLQIFELKPLTTDEMKVGIQAAIKDSKRGFDFPVHLTSEALTFLSQASNGDLRAAYNTLELAALSTPKDDDGQVQLDLEILQECLQSSHLTLDKDGDAHYDLLSALQKSIRGSDVDASLHYGARLIKGGDLDSLARRLTVIAYEDIGLANPQAQLHTVTALEAATRIGLPEARILLANVIIDLALSPKSNSAYMAMNQALTDLEKLGSLPIPDHLRSGVRTNTTKQTYLYPHDYPDKWVDQPYLPPQLRNRSYYQPNQTGRYEQALAARKDWIDHQRQT